jgi:hypothetical protein
LQETTDLDLRYCAANRDAPTEALERGRSGAESYEERDMGFFLADLVKAPFEAVGGLVKGVGEGVGSIISGIGQGIGSILAGSSSCDQAPQQYVNACAQQCQGLDPSRAMQMFELQSALFENMLLRGPLYGPAIAPGCGRDFSTSLSDGR